MKDCLEIADSRASATTPRRGFLLDGLQRLLSVTILLAAGSLMAVDDLPWIPIEGTNRTPSSVMSALPATSEIDTRPGPFCWESALSDIYTLPWGFRLIFR